MAQAMPLRLLVESDASSGAWNMAVDEVLLESALEHNRATLRWYRWSEPTVSIGYFQKREDVVCWPACDVLPVVKRLSGGGAIVHHDEITYSVALPAAHVLARDPLALYERVHSAMIDVLARYDLAATLRGASLPSESPAFLCFHRADPRDVILENYKIVGSAQRRRRGAVLQHGSLLLSRSCHATAIPGIRELAPRFNVETSTLIGALADSIATVFCATTPRPSSLTDAETQRAAELLKRHKNAD